MGRNRRQPAWPGIMLSQVPARPWHTCLLTRSISSSSHAGLYVFSSSTCSSGMEKPYASLSWSAMARDRAKTVISPQFIMNVRCLYPHRRPAASRMPHRRMRHPAGSATSPASPSCQLPASPTHTTPRGQFISYNTIYAIVFTVASVVGSVPPAFKHNHSGASMGCCADVFCFPCKLLSACADCLVVVFCCPCRWAVPHALAGRVQRRASDDCLQICLGACMHRTPHRWTPRLVAPHTQHP